MRCARNLGWMLAVLGLAWEGAAGDAFAISGRLACGSSVELIGRVDCPITITDFPQAFQDEVRIFNDPPIPREGPVLQIDPPLLYGDPQGPRERTVQMTISKWGTITTGPGCPPEGCREGTQPGTYATTIVIRHMSPERVESEVRLPLTVVVKPESTGELPVRATVLEVSGCVEYESQGRRGTAVVGQQLREGDLIETTCIETADGVESWAKLQWSDGTVVQLGFGFAARDLRRIPTRLRIGPWRPEQGLPPGLFVKLLQGVITLMFPPKKPPRDPLEVEASYVALGIRGTVLTLHSDPQTQQDTVSVEEGSIEVIPKNSALSPFTLGAGYEVEVGPDRVGPITPIAPTVNAPRIIRLDGPAFVPIHTYASFSLDFQDPDGDVSWLTVEKRAADGSWAFGGETSAGVTGQTQGTITGQVSCAEVGAVQARAILRDGAGHSSQPWEFNFDCAYEQRVGLEYVLDANSNGILDDAEIRQAIQYWILGQAVPGTSQIIDDPTIRRLIQMWILGEPVDVANAAQAQRFIGSKELDVRAVQLSAPSPLERTLLVQGQGVAQVELQVFDLSGRLVVQEQSPSPTLRFSLLDRQGHLPANGVYLYVITAQGPDGQRWQSAVRKLVVMR